MKIRIIVAAAAIVLGLLIALGPQFLFKVCTPMGEMFMKCHWSAQAEIGVGGMIAALGIALALFTNVKTRFGFAVGVVLSCVFALLIPHVLIGGCSMESMQCRKIAFPAITAISSILLIGSALYTAFLARKK